MNTKDDLLRLGLMVDEIFAEDRLSPEMHELQLYEHHDDRVIKIGDENEMPTRYEQFCPNCKRRFMTEDGMTRHMQRKHGVPNA